MCFLANTIHKFTKMCLCLFEIFIGPKTYIADNFCQIVMLVLVFYRSNCILFINRSWNICTDLAHILSKMQKCQKRTFQNSVTYLLCIHNGPTQILFQQISDYAITFIAFNDTNKYIHLNKTYLLIDNMKLFNDKCCGHNRCTCDHCEPMPLVIESQCCKEINRVRQEMEEAGVDSCITDHPGFAPCCLNPYVLRSANYAFIDHHGHHGPLQAHQHEYVTLLSIVNFLSYLPTQLYPAYYTKNI